MSGPLLEPCDACAGSGTIAHHKRIMENGAPDPADFRLFDLCERCWGGGKVPVNLKAIPERRSGYIADQVGDDGA